MSTAIASCSSATEAATERAPAGTALYVHLPFCAAKCHYCDFFSVAAEGHDRPAMIEAILREAETRAPWRPSTVYVGGGTPSLLSAAELTRLFDGLQRVTGFRDSAVEVTAECNPESLDEDKARCLLDLGVQRMSIGFQSLHDDVLLWFGRVHTVEQSFRAFDAARRAGVANLNVDLIFAVTGQTPEQWERDLERVVALSPDHVSAYNLTFEEDTVFKRRLDRGEIVKESEETELELFERTRDVTTRRGYHAYEISNFARDGRRCLHNVNYWMNGTYLGVGPSAVSKLGHSRAGNVKAIGSYRERALARGHAQAWCETLQPAERLAETWWLGLRLAEGVDPKRARLAAGFDAVADPTDAITQDLIRHGLLEATESQVRLTARGLPLADYVARKYLEL